MSGAAARIFILIVNIYHCSHDGKKFAALHVFVRYRITVDVGTQAGPDRPGRIIAAPRAADAFSTFAGAAYSQIPRDPVVRLIIAGFGGHIKRAILPYCLSHLREHVAIDSVTSLVGGKEEYADFVVPFFRDRDLTPPTYIPELADALSVVSQRPLAVLINTPNTLHFQQASLAMNAGADVFVERPIATPNDSFPALVSAINDANLIAFTGLQRRTEAPFRYMYDCISTRHGFGRLRTIRCSLAVGERPRGWRTDRNFSGGGVVIDSGYHLLDCAVWFASAAGFDVNALSSLYVGFTRSALYPGGEQLESTAIGHLVTSDGLNIFFDLSYDSPVNSVYERISVSDEQGATITLTRSQASRSPVAGVLTHQLADGTVNDPYQLGGLLSTSPGHATPWRPFADFVLGCKQRVSLQDHPCSAYHSVPTWNTIRSIYRHATWQGPAIYGQSSAHDAVHSA
jgi:predicted dehydrogenase